MWYNLYSRRNNMKDKTILLNNGVDVDASLELFGDMEPYNETLNDLL